MKAVSGIMVTSLLTCLLTLTFDVQLVKGSATIYIRSDGSVYPSTANITSLDKVTYTFNGNNYDSIVVLRNNIVIDGAGHTLQGPGSKSGGIELTRITNVTIQNLNIKGFDYGISITQSSYINIFGNIITMNKYYGIDNYHSDNNNICVNNISANYASGIAIGFFSRNNMISGNNILTNNEFGIHLSQSSSNSIYENIISANNRWGIYLFDSTSNNIYGNNITANNEYGIWFCDSPNNSFYHNNFVDNHEQVRNDGSINTWNDSYPSGGNYWSDYAGIDLFSGPDQNETASDGIGDTPYVIDADNRDNYPLMNPLPPQYKLTVTSTPIVGITLTINGIQKVTPYTDRLSEDSYIIEMLETHDGYVWSHWLEDGDANRTKTVTLNTTVTLTACYRIIEDLNDDGIVDIDDIIMAALAFGSYPDHPRWSSQADINQDGIVDIEDVASIAINFGKTI